MSFDCRVGFSCDLDRFLYDLKETRVKGVIGMITGNHDMQRLAYRRTPDEVKVAMAFLFSMPGVPFVYYGDEIGMDYIEGLPSKEGGYIRTGSRTPMQWNNEKNHGFSTSDTPYLPTDSRDNAPTVEKQADDENSILSLVKNLINLHKSNSALHSDGEFNVIKAGYPFIFERYNAQSKLIIAVNPSKYEYSDVVKDFGKNYNVLLEQNVDINGNNLIMHGVSFVVAEKKH